MSVFFQTAINTGKLHSFRKLLNTSFKSCNCLLVRKCSDVGKKFVSFDEVVAQRRAEARRSFVVQVNSEASFNELYGYCSKYATINGVHHYKNSGGEHFMLVEFSSEDNLKEIARSCSAHQKDIDVMALPSPFVWFRAVTGKKGTTIEPITAITSKNGSDEIDEDVLFEELMNCNNVSQQIQTLYDKTALNDLGVRLRYMVARQLENIFESMYANVAVRPFGSSVNGFGKMGCDLDLVLTNVVPDEQNDSSKRLVFQEKKCEGGRSQWQRHMELVAEILELRVPGAFRVQRILHARVPIVKFTHLFTDIDCDLCYNNISGVYMSELLWLYGSLDPRVRPLTLVVRRWAQTVGLTNQHPGRWITNFPLTLMVLFFLQNTKGGVVLPSFRTLVRKAGKEDMRLAEENLNCTFLRDMNKLSPDTYGQNDMTLEALLLQFFEFYSQFDFQDKAISVVEGAPVRKPNNLPLYIVNPLEQAMNVSRNVSYEECEKLKLEVRNAAWQLDSSYERQKNEDWGLVALLEKKAARSLKRLLRVGNSHRLVSVKDLFKEEEGNEENGLRSKMTRLTQKTDKEVNENAKENKETISRTNGKGKDQKIKFKNTHVASEVYRIRRDKIV